MTDILNDTDSSYSDWVADVCATAAAINIAGNRFINSLLYQYNDKGYLSNKQLNMLVIWCCNTEALDAKAEADYIKMYGSGGEIGRHSGLKIRRTSKRAGSTPARSTKSIKHRDDPNDDIPF